MEDPRFLNNQDSYPLYLFHEGTNYEAYKLMSPARMVQGGVEGWRFRTFAPRAEAVSVVGDFNGWTPGANPMERDDNGVWTAFVPG
ncbi:MAG TPA: 1,4-alpha-glucan branching enzyme, partial [Eubacteriales bacterium]|nr:1,4-alpha-glucan branching enzyme [Eubacteriales bacterium]